RTAASSRFGRRGAGFVGSGREARAGLLEKGMFEMRKLALLLGVTLLAGSAHANTINFGSWNSSLTTCSLAGTAGDMSCSHAGTVNNGANDATANAAVV